MADEIKIEICSATEVDGLWPMVSDGFREASIRSGGEVDPTDHWTLCRSGRAFLILAVRGGSIIAAGVWMFENWLTGKKIRCLLIYGRDMKEWFQPYRGLILKIAKVGGATAMVTEGRSGWGRVVPEAVELRRLYEEKI